jgi:trimeric autotransporter adhesin
LMPRMTTAQKTAIASPAIGLQVYDTNLNAIYVYNGAWTAVGAGGGSGTVTSVTGTAPITVTNTTTTPVISMAQATTAVSGYLSSSDWTTFNSKLTATVAAPASGQFIRYNGTNWVNSVVTSSDITTALTSYVAPVTSGGTGLSTLTAGSILVGNGTGTPTFLAGGAVNNLIYATGATTWASASADSAGVVDKANTQTISGAKTLTNNLTLNAQNTVRFADADSSNWVALRSPATVVSNITWSLPSADGTAGQSLTTNASGTLGWTSDFSQGGNSFGTTAAIGTNDANNLNIKTSGSVRASFDTSGGMQITGQAWSQVATSSAATPLSWDANSSNVMRWSVNTSNITVNITNMRAGAAYMLVVKGSGTGTTTITCAGTGVTSSTPLFVPANGNRVGGTATSKTVYTIMADGENCLVTWITGY